MTCFYRLALEQQMIAKRMSKMDSSGIRKVFDLAAKMKNPVDLSIGQPDFDVPEPIKRALIDAVARGRNRYTVTQGIAPLREKLAERIAAEHGWEKPSVLVTSGVSGGLLLAMMVLVDPGDEVLVPDPYFVMYKHHVNLLGGVCRYYTTYPDFELDPDRIASLVTAKTKILLLNSPSNPTGAVFSADRIAEAGRIAEKHGLIVVSDEIYDHFCYDGAFASAANCCSRVLLMGGFSKSYGMTGWRLGYAAGTAAMAPAIAEMTKLQQYSFVCAPSMVQEAGLVALDTDVSAQMATMKRKRDLIYEGLRGKFNVRRPSGAFYMFPEAPGGSGTEFVRRAIDASCLVIPGNVFSERDTHFRICYATDEGTIRRGIEILNALA
jgi:aspartate aminotransferase